MANEKKPEEVILYQRTNTKKNLAASINKKKEPRPKFIQGDLERYYEKTDLELVYVFDCCKSLKPLKGIDVNSQQVEFWYKEFLRMGWKKKYFDKQFEIIKRADLFGRIDLASWLKTEIIYNEYDLNFRVGQIVDSMIQKGKLLKDYKIKLTPEEIKFVELAVSKEIELEYINKRYQAMDDKKEELRKAYINQLSDKKKIIATLTFAQKIEITDKLFKSGKIGGKPEGFIYQATLHNLEDHADLIDDTWLLYG